MAWVSLLRWLERANAEGWSKTPWFWSKTWFWTKLDQDFTVVVV